LITAGRHYQARDDENAWRLCLVHIIDRRTLDFASYVMEEAAGLP